MIFELENHTPFSYLLLVLSMFHTTSPLSTYLPLCILTFTVVTTFLTTYTYTPNIYKLHTPDLTEPFNPSFPISHLLFASPLQIPPFDIPNHTFILAFSRYF
ncbi:hypothetical protein ACJQWK_02552 [Exserohilum turcicum]